MIESRGWQSVAIEKFFEHKNLSFLLEATPGGGKTIASALIASRLEEYGVTEFSIIVVPTIVLKGDKFAGFLAEWHKAGIELTTVLKDGKGWPKEYKGGVITYSQLPNFVSTIEVWKRAGLKLFLVFDEIHHASEDNKWGIAAECAARCAAKILVMTGTPFRGDGRRISFVDYDENGIAKPDYRYTYREAVRDKICRPVEFMTDDGVAEFVRNNEEYNVRIADASNWHELSGASNTVFRHDSHWLETVIAKADDCLDSYRISDAKAGGLIICRPGSCEHDEKHLRQVAALVKRVTGDDPVVVSYDDESATTKINEFRDSNKKWICAVRKISEGVDIKRLRVLVIANRPTTELLFRQIVGRIIRAYNKKRIGIAIAFIAKFPQLCEWAARFRDEAEAGLHDLEELERDQHKKEESSFVALGSTHEDGGAISDFGDEFSAAEINAAERDKIGDIQLQDIPITKLAYYRRKMGIIADPIQPTNDPLQIEKKRIREDLNKACRRLAIRRNPESPDFKKVYVDIHKHTGAKDIDDLMDNYNIDVMRQALSLVNNWLGGKDAAA